MKKFVAVVLLLGLASSNTAQTTVMSSGSGSSSFSIDTLASATFCSDTGSSDAYACNFSPAPANLAAMAGAVVTFKAGTVNTGAATFAPNGFTAKAIVKVGQTVTTALLTNDIRDESYVTVVYDSANDVWACLSCDGNRAGLTASNTFTGQNSFTASNNSFTGIAQIYGQVNAVTTTATTSLATSNQLYTNTGDADGATITLMNDPTAGAYWSFAVTEAQTLTIVASTGETLKHGSSTCGTSLTSNTVGSTILIRVVIGGSGGSMYTFGSEGSWTCNA